MEQPPRHLGIDVAGRLVGDQQLGWLITARAMATRCCSPPESVGGRALARSASPTHASISRTGPSTSSSRRRRCAAASDIVERRQMADQREVLEHHADAAAEGGQRIALGVGQFLVEQADAAERRRWGP